jgi:phage terminase large subunit GpA-like protein
MAQAASLSSFDLPSDAWLPREWSPPSVWAPKNIYIDGRSGSVPGYYSHSRFPYSREVIDAFVNPRVEKIILDWATQLGKTTNLGTLVGWIADNDPAPTMIVCANEKAAQAHYTRMLAPALERIESVRKRLPPKGRRRWQIVEAGDMFIFYAWPGSKATVSDRPIKYLFGNEISLWKAPLGSEGDPLEMAMDRTKAFYHPGRKIVLEGKPTIEGECRLTMMLNHSRKHTLHLPCPSCGEYQPLFKGKSAEPGGIKWDEDYDSPYAADHAADSVYWECRNCLERHSEEVKLPALSKSIWVPEGQRAEKDRALSGTPLRSEREVGFHLSSLYSTIATWRDFAKRWVPAREMPSKLQAVVNGWLAETWKRKLRKTKSDDVADHKDEYVLGKVPKECLGVVLSVDVQEDSFWYVVRAWGWLGESWLVTYGIANTWAALEQVRSTTWEGKDGELHPVWLTIIDSAFQRGTNEVYDWCRMAGPTAIPIRGEHQYRQLLMVRQDEVDTHAIPIWHIDAGQIRDQFYFNRLRKRGDEPGAWRIPKDVRQDYLRSICAWEKQEKEVGGQKKKIWVSTSPDYEHFADCELMQEACAFVYRFGEMRAPQIAAASRPNEGPVEPAWLVTQRS